MTEEFQKRVNRLQEISDELFVMANSFAGDETGTAAVEIHRSTHVIWNAIRILKQGATRSDKEKQIREHLQKTSAFPMSEESLQRMVNLMLRDEPKSGA